MHDLIEGSYSCRLEAYPKNHNTEEIIRAEKEESLTFSLCLSSCHSWFITHQPSPHLNWSAAKKKDDYAKIRRQQWCYRELPYMNYNRKDSIFRTAHTKQTVTISCMWSRLDSYSNSDQFFQDEFVIHVNLIAFLYGHAILKPLFRGVCREIRPHEQMSQLSWTQIWEDELKYLHNSIRLWTCITHLPRNVI